MKDLRILAPREVGKGILVEYDAGYINPMERRNLDLIRENKSFLDYSKPFEFYAVLQKYNTPNRNGRIYPEKILKREAENYKKIIQKGVALSELNHLAANYLRQGVTLGISSRGVGSLKKVGDQNEVQDDFELICFDLVSSPSTPGAYLYMNPEERLNFEENLDEEKQRQVDLHIGETGNASLDLMKRLTDYLNK